MALGWLTWELTSSGTWLGLMAAAGMLPMVFVGPLAGVTADRFGHRLQLVTATYIGAMIALRENEHFTVDLLPTPKTNQGKALSLMFVDLMTFIMAFIFVVWGWPLVEFGLLQTSEMAELPMVFIYIAWPLTGVTWILFLIERTVGHIKLFRSVVT